MISLSHNFIFVHIPKTGGTSIQSLLMKYSEDRIVYKDKSNPNNSFWLFNDQLSLKKHSKLKEYKNKIDYDTYKKMFRFAVIRNPWDMMISWYFSPHSGRTQWDRDKFIKLLYSVPRPRNFLLLPSLKTRILEKIYENLKIPDSLYNIKLDRDIDYLIKFENLESDWNKVCKLIGITPETLPKKHKSKRLHYSHYYDDELKELVANKFVLEIKYMGYKFENKD
ncbi:MAG: sulfotransferase family 2 domain-containing protein [Crocosphaera sp.]|nr:sulfotransferase family 2 domain-containing protein [Crocosphaera sp.]